MAVLNININAPGIAITEFNASHMNASNIREQINALVNLLGRIDNGQYQATIIATSRDTNPTVNTSGADSQQLTFTRT